MARAVVGQLVDVDKRLLALGGIAVFGLLLEVFLVVLLGFVEFLLEAAHLSEVEIEFALTLVVFFVGQAFVDSLGTGIVVGQAVAFGNLEVDTVFFGLVVFDFFVGGLIFPDGFDEAVLIKKIVSLGGVAFRLGVGTSGHQHDRKQHQETFFKCFHKYIYLFSFIRINISINSLNNLDGQFNVSIQNAKIRLFSHLAKKNIPFLFQPAFSVLRRRGLNVVNER